MVAVVWQPWSTTKTGVTDRDARMKAEDPIIVDLFCGAGGLSLGAARAGFTVQGGVDVDPQALKAHAKNFPKAAHLLTDVAELTGNSVRSAFGIETDLVSGVIGGPPCQGFSNMGRRNRDDIRNHLFFDFFRLVLEIEPSFFLAENVPGIMHQQNSEIVERAISYVSGKYHVLAPFTVSANAYGAPTTRTRVFFVGYIPDRMCVLTGESFRAPSDVERVFVKDALGGLPLVVDPSWQKESDGWQVVRVPGLGHYSSRLHGQIPDDVGDPVALHRLKTEGKASGTLGTRHSPAIARRYAAMEPGESDPISKSRRLELEGYCPTLRAGTGPELGSFQAVRPIHPTMPRVITPREAARLQGFPDWFTFSPTKWHTFRQIGASVSPIVAEHLMTAIQSSIQQ